MVKGDRVVAALLQLVLLMTVMGQPDSRNDDELLSEEARLEALALVADFNSRFEDSGDIRPLMDELFTRDFAQRLRSVRGGAIGSPISSVSPVVVQHASDEEVLRYYAETTNFMYLYLRKHGNAEFIFRESGGEENIVAKDLTTEDVLGAEVCEVLRADPVLRDALFAGRENEVNEPTANEQTGSEDSPVSAPAEVDTSRSEQDQKCDPEDSCEPAEVLAEEEKGDKDESPTEREDGFQYSLNTVDEWKRHLAVLEKANVLLRRNLSSSLTVKTLLDARQQSATEENEQPDVQSVELTTLTFQWMDYPVGTRIVCVAPLFFHMDLVQADGRLKVAALYLPSRCS